jgi:hypothetical protein
VRYVERLARRSTIMQGLAGRIVGAPRGLTSEVCADLIEGPQPLGHVERK